jgi:DNA-binding protein H-NS
VISIDWPVVVLIMFVILVGGVALGGPNRRRHELQMAEVKSKGHAEYQALAEKFESLARETREAQATMQADLAAVRVSVQAIETMMRDVS